MKNIILLHRPFYLSAATSRHLDGQPCSRLCGAETADRLSHTIEKKRFSFLLCAFSVNKINYKKFLKTAALSLPGILSSHGTLAWQRPQA